MKRTLIPAFAGIVLTFGAMSGPVLAASVPSGALAAKAVSGQNLVQEAKHRWRRGYNKHRYHNRRFHRHRRGYHRHYRFRPRYYGYLPYCGKRYTCWWSKYGYRKCGWVRRRCW